MGNKLFSILLLLYLKWMWIWVFIDKAKSADSNDKDDTTSKSDFNPNYTLNTYDTDGNYIKTFYLEFNYDINMFDNTAELYSITNTKKFVICNDDDVNKSDEEKNTILLWNTSNIYEVYSTIVYLNVFPYWYNEQRAKGKIFCMRIDAVGWEDNVNKEICKDYEPYKDCPDLIILGTTQLAKRYYNKETHNLNKFYTNYFKKNGKSIESMLNKYSIYD
eukprot:jgi/Orpsp1_1/1187421/evm.model.d7180000057587.1